MRCCWILLFALLCLAVHSSQLTAEEPYDFKIPAGLPKMKLPANNPLSAAKIELGKQLYFDPRLSRDNTVSCATCHDPEKGWSNGAKFATGIREQVGGRSAPTILNSGYSYYQFWDGRALEVEGQALGPVQNPIEMDLTLPELEKKLNDIPGYKQQFEAVFGAPANSENIAKAIGAFERTVLSGDAPYDRYKAGDTKALSDAAQRGMKVFFSVANCSSCHSGPNFSDGAFHNIGVGMEHAEPDVGRVAHSKIGGDHGAFKTPTLRDISRTAPYMHNGSLATLEEVIDYYAKGGTPNPQLDEEIFAFKLTPEQKADLIIFLKEGLASSNYPAIKPPKLPD